MNTLGKLAATVGEKLGIPNLDPDSGLIFVTGGTGVVGYRVSKKLLLAGHPMVRFGCHYHGEKSEANEKLIAELNKLGGEVADFQWSNEATFEKALAGVKTVFCTAPYVKEWNTVFPAFLEACKKAGVKHFVKLSFYHARKSGDAFQEVPLVRAHGDLDEMLAKSHISYSILAATHFMSNPFYFQNRELRKDQKPACFYGASAGKGVNYVSPNDVAEMAVRVILDPKAHHNKEYTLTGPEPISDQVVSQLLAKHLNKPIMFADQPVHTFEEGVQLSGDPEWMVLDLVALEKIKASGVEEANTFVTKDIEKVCGHPAETFEDYLSVTEFMTPMEAA
jgi:NAD(P)H dehydrogenase (quinone)